jgi:hypothetical protein
VTDRYKTGEKAPENSVYEFDGYTNNTSASDPSNDEKEIK